MEEIKDKTVKLNEVVKVRALKKAKHLQEGKEYEVHPIQARKLVDKGYVELVKDIKKTA